MSATPTGGGVLELFIGVGGIREVIHGGETSLLMRRLLAMGLLWWTSMVEGWGRGIVLVWLPVTICLLGGTFIDGASMTRCFIAPTKSPSMRIITKIEIIVSSWHQQRPYNVSMNKSQWITHMSARRMRIRWSRKEIPGIEPYRTP